MKLPYTTRERPIQGNFDFIARSFGSYKLSDIQQTTVSAPAGATGFPINKAGLSKIMGIIIVEMSPAAHWAFTYYPRPTIPDFVINNTGAVQNVAVSYIVVGR